jgi:prepilin-type N-terminal cleavage/methylation domain-containing protein
MKQGLDRQRLRRTLRQRGVTLIELLTVIAILTALMGISAYTYIRMSRNYKEQGAAADLDIVLRQARNSAISGNSPAFVQIDPAKGRAVPWLYKTVGLWHLEEKASYGKTRGGMHDGMFRGGEIFPEGRIGKCARLRDNAYIDIGSDPDFDLEDGGYLEAHIRPLTYQFTGDNFILSKQGSYALWIRQGGVLCGEAGGKRVEAKNYKIAPNRWTKVAMAWDSTSLRLMIDDGLVGVGPGCKAPTTQAPLLIGHESASLIGLVDEVRVMAATSGKEFTVPPRTEIKLINNPWNAVYFAPDGTLDMRFHPGPVAISLTSGNKIRTINVSMMGQTRRMEVDNTAPAEEQQQDVAERPRITPEQQKKLKVYADDPAAEKGTASSKSDGGAK